jgi:ABC-type antimicrobial peptide transport system permease subunit
VLIHLADARQLTGVSTVTALAVNVPIGQAAQLAQRLQPILPQGVKAYDLFSLLEVVANRVRVSRIVMVPIGLLFALFAALAVTNTVLVSVLERRKEFGMVAAIGLSTRQLARMVVLESLITTLLGWLLGLAAGYGIIKVFSTWNLLGSFLSSVARSLGSFGIGEEIYANVSAAYALYATATIVVAAIFANLVPARIVRKLEPVKAMRD